jgi:hypothetical protein
MNASWLLSMNIALGSWNKVPSIRLIPLQEGYRAHDKKSPFFASASDMTVIDALQPGNGQRTEYAGAGCHVSIWSGTCAT